MSSCKRSHDDLDDADECLPISKRINSLHIEGQSHSVNLLGPNGTHVSPIAGFCDGSEALNSRLMGNHNHGAQINLSQAGTTRRLDVNCEMTTAPRLPTINEQDYFEMNQRHSATSMNQHFSDSMNDPSAPYQNPSVQHYATTSSHTQSSIVSSFPSSESHQKLPSQTSHHTDFYLPGQHRSLTQICSESTFSSHSLPMTTAISTENVPQHDQQLAMLHHTHNTQQLPQHNFPNGHSSSYPQVHQDQLSLFPSNHNEQQQLSSHFQRTSPGHPQQLPQSPYSHDFHTEQLPSGEYNPELGVTENPFYFSINRMLYEAHLSRVRRDNSFHNHS